MESNRYFLNSKKYFLFIFIGFLFICLFLGIDINAEDNISFERKNTQSLMSHLPNFFHKEKITTFYEQSSLEKDLALVFLIQSSKINSLNYALVDLPIEISKEIIRIIKLLLIDDIPELLGEIEKISVDFSKNKVLNFLQQHEIRVAGGAISYPYKDKNNKTQEFYIQYLLTFYPNENKNDGSGEVVINFYSNKVAEPYILKTDVLGMTTENYSEKNDPLDPFIATVSGKVKKGYLNLYEWDGNPTIEITFPEEVPDLGIKPLSFWERKILEPISKIKNDVQFFVKKTLDIDLNLDKVTEIVLDVFNRFKDIFTKNRSNISADLINKLPEDNSKEEIMGEGSKEEFFYVKRMIDGDTIELENGEIVRLLGIDTPEEKECLYSEAKSIIVDKLEGKIITLEKEGEDKDIYGRILRYVYIDDLFINDYLVKNGFAQYNSYGTDLSLKNQLINSEKEAFNNKLGIWGEKCSPKAIISEEIIEVEENQEILLDGSLSEDNFKIVSYKWDLDDSNGFNWNNPDLEGKKVSFNSSVLNNSENVVTFQVTDNSGNTSYSNLLIKILEDPKILITEIQIEGDKTSEDFIEIYNDSDRSINISGYKLRKRTESGKEYSIAVIPNDSIIEAKGYYVWSNYENDFSDLNNSSYISKNNSIALINNDKVIDQVAWGLGENPFVEEHSFNEEIEGNQTIGRILDNSIYIDTNNNSEDFEVQSPTPGYANRKLVLEDEEETEKEKEQNNKILKECSYNPGMISKKDIIFNEIAWMGTKESSNDEWIELKNSTNEEISLNEWQIFNESKKISISFDNINYIKNNEYFLLERTDDTSVPSEEADYIYVGAIKNSLEKLYLFDNNCQLQDIVIADPNWERGNNSTKKTMERRDDFSWQTSLHNGGTPKKKNSSGFVEVHTSTSESTEEVIDEVKPTVSISYSTSSDSLSLYLEWEGLDNDKIKGYIFRYSIDKSSWIYSLGENTTTTVFYNFKEGSDATYYFQVKAIDNSDNESDWEEVSYTFNLDKSIIINEIAWMGTTDNDFNEWIELYNNSASSTDLLGWKITSNDDFEIEFTESLIIEGNSYLLLERTADDTVSDISADYIYTGGLSNSGLDLMIYNDQEELVDKVPCVKNSNNNCKGWMAGDNSKKITMERISTIESGSNDNNWANNNIITINGKNSSNGRIFGSPKQINSISKTETVIESLPFDSFEEITLVSFGAPYIINNIFTIPEGKTLSINPGITVKFKENKGGFNVYGKLDISGDLNNMVKLTTVSTDSDSYWCGIRINSATGTSEISGALIEKSSSCGGKYNSYYYQSSKYYVINVVDSSIYIKDSVFSNNQGLMGVRSYNSSTTIEGTEFNGFNDEKYSTVVYSNKGTLNLLNNLFNNNSYGLVSEDHTFNTINNNNFINNDNPIYLNSSYFNSSNNHLENNNYNGIIVNGYISSSDFDINLDKDVPIIIDKSAIIRENSKLILNEGVIVKFKSRSYLTVSGELISNGNTNNKVIFTSILDDLNDLGSNYSSDTNNDGESNGNPGDWDYIHVESNATTTLDNIIVRNGGRKKNNKTGALWIEGYLELTNSVIENNIISGVMLSEGSTSSIKNTIFRNNYIEYPSSFGSHGLWIDINIEPELNELTINDNYYGLKWIGYEDCESLAEDSRFIFINNQKDYICN